jgi:hypothetical protein
MGKRNGVIGQKLAKLNRFVLGACIIVGAHSVASASTSLPCRPGAHKQEFGSARYIVRIPDQRTLQQRLGSWAQSAGYSTRGERGEDPASERETWSSLLESPRGGVRIEIRFIEGSSIAELHVTNNCWAAAEDWRPHWQRIQSRLSDWGYRKVA